jgi:hypothetical protein
MRSYRFFLGVIFVAGNGKGNIRRSDRGLRMSKFGCMYVCNLGI